MTGYSDLLITFHEAVSIAHSPLNEVEMGLRTIGRREMIDLPELKLFSLEAKIDTGAYGCAIHCHDVEETSSNGSAVLRFKLLDPSHPEYQDLYHEVGEYGRKEVKNSFGDSELRYTIITMLQIFDTAYEVEFSLADRVELKYPVLLGRTFLFNQFVVDVSKLNMSSIKKRKK